MRNFKVTLENKINSNKFHINLVYEPKEKEEINFKFGNSSKGIERSDLEFLDENLVLINPISVRVINVAKSEKIEIIISKNSPFIYEVIGEIKDVNRKIYIKLASVEYLLEKRKKYYLQLRYLGEVSEKIEFQF